MEEQGCSFSSSSSGPVLLRGSPPLPPHPLPKLVPSPSSPPTTAEKLVALRIHKEAEQRRRERINAHFSTLRRLVPNSTKMDKACLLGKVIDQVKELKRKVSDISQVSRVPKEVNDVSVECSISHHHDDNDDEDLYMKASVCCEDRPDLFAQLTEAFQRLGLRTIKAEVVSLGGRTHSAFLLCLEDRKQTACLSSSMESLRRALDAIASKNKDVPSEFSSKRRRMMQIPRVQ
ncbi:transcription factor bHLH51-like [Curcuma longa]|uniref:transcription factor bHLH51-like n=1 Tax=Curcuma longa TaxID=136217 RepID=UPI003D9E7FD6